jgi:ABC-type antimicrobial peptide transport system permease subunit
MIEDFVSSGHAADLIIAVMAIEAVFLAFFLRKRGLSRLILGFWAALLAGAALVLALRTALTGGSLGVIALCMGASFVAHLIELSLKIVSARTNPDYEGRA